VEPRARPAATRGQQPRPVTASATGKTGTRADTEHEDHNAPNKRKHLKSLVLSSQRGRCPLLWQRHNAPLGIPYRIYAHYLDGRQRTLARPDGASSWLARREGQPVPESPIIPLLTWADARRFIPCIFREPRQRGASGGIWLHVIGFSPASNPLVSGLRAGETERPRQRPQQCPRQQCPRQCPRQDSNPTREISGHDHVDSAPLPPTQLPHPTA
jgi:hypothetical protein